MTKKQRLELFNKYGGKCAYCGCDLPERWHADHIKPVVRNPKYFQERDGLGAFQKPENNTVENMNPSCPACNILKGSGTIESLRMNIENFVNSLNNYHNQYKFAKRYGLVKETNNRAVFYFEKI